MKNSRLLFVLPRRGITAAVFILSVLFPCLSFCQKWLTHHYSEADGLASSTVYDITQDHHGRMWFATRSGITCYNGVSWKQYDDSDGLPPDPSLVKLHVDRLGVAWAMFVLPRPGEVKVAYFDEEEWVYVENLETGSRATSFQLLEKGEKMVVLVGTARSGIYWWEKGKWENINTSKGLIDDRVNDIAISDGKCYVATDNGLSAVDENRVVDSLAAEGLAFPAQAIKGIYVEEKGKYPESSLPHSRIWLFGDKYLGYLGKNNQKTVYFDTGITFGQPGIKVTLLSDYRTGLYIGSANELFYFNYKTRKMQRVTEANGLLNVGANALFCDFEKNIWIACARGVTKIASRRFSSFQMMHGLLEDEVCAVLEYEPGKFVFGHNFGLTFYDENSSPPRKIPFLQPAGSQRRQGRVLDMKIDSKGNIWAACSGMGLAKVDKNGKVKWYLQQGLPSQAISLWIDPKDNVWMSTEVGIYIINRHGVVSKGPPGYPQVNTRKIFGSKERLLYFATFEDGIYAFEKNRWKNYRAIENKKADSVYSIKEDSAGRLLVGTAAGLYTRRYGTLDKFTEGDFAIDRPIYFIVEDRDLGLWFGTDNGVIHRHKGTTAHYSIPQGLIGQETNRAAGQIDSRGRLWVGTNRGVSVYDEVFDNQRGWNPPPRLRLLYLEVNGEKRYLEEPVHLSYRESRVLFHFSGISFQDERNVRFKHKLAGFDKDWSKEHYLYKQVIEYTNLDPGSYRFHIRAGNAMGVWSDVVSSEEIVILRPFYNTWWFSLLILIALGLLFYSAFYFVSTRRSAVKLEKLVKERTGQLLASEKRYRDLFAESQDMVFITSTAGKILDINPAGIALLGYGSEEEVKILDIEKDLYFNPADGLAFMEEIRKKSDVKDYEVDFKKKSGEKITVLITASLVREKKREPVMIRGIVRDITEKKRLQQQLAQSQKMEAVGTLAGGIAHDFNNILGMISGYLDLTIDELEEGSRPRQNLERVITASNRAKELVKQILTFSRQSSQERKPLNISFIVKEALKLLRSTLPSTIEIRQDIAAESSIVLAEPTQMHQVIMNLCTNAAYAMRESGGVLELGLHEIRLDAASAGVYDNLNPGRYLRLTAADTGPGIDPAIIKRVFEPYFTTKKTGQGTGMGLAVAHGIVKNHGGDIAVQSEPGRGTVFHVLLPFAEGVKEVPERLMPGGIPTGRDERILFVDDEPLLVEVGQLLLEMLGYRVTAKSGSLEAFDVFSAAPDDFDLILTDLTMPNMTGLQLARKIKEIRPDIPIVLCTGFSETITSGQIASMGVADFLMKPIDKKSLAHAIRRVLDKEKENPG